MYPMMKPGGNVSGVCNQNIWFRVQRDSSLVTGRGSLFSFIFRLDIGTLNLLSFECEEKFYLTDLTDLNSFNLR